MQTWRRRQCTACKAIFTTIEGADFHTSIAVRSETATQPFSRDKLFVSILRAIGHRAEPIEDASGLTATVISQLLRMNTEASYHPSEIATVTHAVLQRFDTAAAVQYQAYHARALK